ncbi:hypothetical protein F5880DRAFT_1540420 [Lentinula raphanica]|nr:hypothetical protein F5880DRAFT_1540420 [Lentinula raphanica]
MKIIASLLSFKFTLGSSLRSESSLDSCLILPCPISGKTTRLSKEFRNSKRNNMSWNSSEETLGKCSESETPNQSKACVKLETQGCPFSH